MMDRIRWGRVILGGVAAGFVINVGEWLVNGVLMAEEMEEAAAQMGIEPATGSDIGLFVVMGFVLGIVLVWLYAAIRPRYGPGAKTAILAGLLGWVLLYAFWYIYNIAWELFPPGLVRTSTIWGLFELPLATLVGAWLYREEGTS